MKRLTGRVVIVFEDVDIEVEDETDISSIKEQMFPDGYEGCICNIDTSDAEITECD